MKLKNIAAILCAVAIGASMLGGCSQKKENENLEQPSTEASQSQPLPVQPPEAKAVVRVGALQGPSGLGMVQLMEENELQNTGSIYEFTLAGAPDEISGKIVTGELDIACVPTNLAATLYAKTEGKVKVIGLTTLGVLYVMQKNEEDPIKTIAELKGETVYTAGQGATQEHVLNYLLAKNELTEKDVTIEYKSEHAEVAALLQEGTAEYALLPQPFVTAAEMKDDTVQAVLDLTKEWETATEGTELPMGCIVVRADFLEKNPATVDKFLEEFTDSVEAVKEDPETAAALAAKYEVLSNEQVAAKAIPKCNLVSTNGESMKTAVASYLEILYNAEPKSVGGNLPDDGFYYVP